MSRRFSAEITSSRQLPKGVVHVVPNKVTALPKPGRGFVSRETRQYLTNLKPGEFHLLPDAFVGLPDGEATAHVNVHDEKRYTREESRNLVRFGQMVIGNDPARRERIADVAIKPLNAPGLAAREFGAMAVINSLAAERKMAPSLQTLGFYRDPDDMRVNLLTAYEPSILTLDNLFWDPNFQPPESMVKAGLSHCAFSLAELHANGIAHGDAQVKNIGVDNKGVRYVDLEGAQEFAGQNGALSPLTAQRLMEIDVSTCIESLHSVSPEQIAESFIPVYMDRVGGSDLPAEALLSRQMITNLMQ